MCSATFPRILQLSLHAASFLYTRGICTPKGILEVMWNTTLLRAQGKQNQVTVVKRPRKVSTLLSTDYWTASLQFLHVQWWKETSSHLCCKEQLGQQSPMPIAAGSDCWADLGVKPAECTWNGQGPGQRQQGGVKGQQVGGQGPWRSWALPRQGLCTPAWLETSHPWGYHC